jgi:hypothetical protein
MRYVLLSLLLFVGCGSEDLHVIEIECVDDGMAEPRMVEPALLTGNLDAGGRFHESDPSIAVAPGADQVFFQAALKIDELYDYDPEFLRIEFASDKSEWVGMGSAGTDVYSTEEECYEYSEYCEEIVVAKGTSGYFETENDMLAIQNSYCRDVGQTYTYAITAVVYNIAPWPIEEISEQVSIEIECHLGPDKSQRVGL